MLQERSVHQLVEIAIRALQLGDSQRIQRPSKPIIRQIKLRVKAEPRREDLPEDSAEARARRWTPLSAIEEQLGPESFEEVIEDILASLVEARAEMLKGQIEINHLVRDS